MMEDWRFQESPYVESGGMRAYAGVPLRLQNESGDYVAIGSLCVISPNVQEPLTRSQQRTLAHLADWIVSDIVQCARARRQRDRRRMTELIAAAQNKTADEDDAAAFEEPVLDIIRSTYPEAAISLKPTRTGRIEVQGRDPIQLSDLEDGLWEDTEHLDDLIEHMNHQELPRDRVVRVIAAPCESTSGPSLLAVASTDFRLVFDDIDQWFVQTCAGIISQMWHKRLLAEALRAKDKFLRGFSHQLRTPIHGILGSVDLLAEELAPRKNILEAASSVAAKSGGGPAMYLDTIKTSGRDLISIVNSMITLNRWTDIAMTDRHPVMRSIDEIEADLANEMVRTISGDMRYRASILFDNNASSTDCNSIRIDHDLLRDTLLPLIINAIQYTPEGTVKVTTALHPDRRELIVDVEDTGVGIHIDHQQRIFEPYEKVAVHSTGAGLGLTLATKFATLLNGSVVLVSSDTERGSHFRATFREVECISTSSSPSSPPSPQDLASKFQNLPIHFYNLAATSSSSSSSSTASISSHFAGFLSHHGFSLTDDPAYDCFAIVEYITDIEQRRALLSQIPANKIAICLVPASQSGSSMEDTPSNVVYFRGPFFTMTMISALEEAERLLTDIKTASEAQKPHSEEPCLARLKIDDDSSNMDDSTSITSDYPKPPLAADSLDAAATHTTTTTTTTTIQHHDHSLLLAIEPRLVTPIFPTLSSCPSPAALLVDDNSINLRIMKLYCSKRGLSFVCATNGQEAVDIFTARQTSVGLGGVIAEAPIQLILMDLQMPVCDGIEATRQIRQLEKENGWGKSALFIVTGQDTQTDRAAAEEVGADEYFVKPVHVKVLDRGVKQYFPDFKPG
jgi:signal transduction histidine kinase/ActR/RegA family two-component response regulator